jgi:L-asparaginase/Glu-tRNA(Gln) amidotransferase subunit D
MSGHREDLIGVLSSWASANEAIVIAKTHSPYGSTDLSKYELGIKALQMGILPSLDMTLESAFTKASQLLASGVEGQEFKRLFYTNLCGEFDDVHVRKFLLKAKHWLTTS